VCVRGYFRDRAWISHNQKIIERGLNMKCFLAGITLLAAGAISATVVMADGPAGGSLKDAPPATSCGSSAFNWNGAFAGIQLGTANFRSVTAVEDILGLATSREDSGFTIGGVVGYNWQKCNTVFGIEADLAWTDVDRPWGLNLGGAIPGLPPLFTARSTMDLYGSVKMRTGFAFDNLLLYLTGGFAFANIEHKGANTGALGILPAGAGSWARAPSMR
jgi:outer membrane immunogenic protein